jgi:hypothetical protein
MSKSIVLGIEEMVLKLDGGGSKMAVRAGNQNS